MPKKEHNRHGSLHDSSSYLKVIPLGLPETFAVADVASLGVFRLLEEPVYLASNQVLDGHQ